MHDDFAIFIITHKHPDKQLTYDTLRNCGYTGKIYLVVDDTDSTIQQYIDNYGKDNVVIFNKNYYINSERFDNGTNDSVYACAVYARRAVEDIAKHLGYSYFVMADDDITKLSIRYPVSGKLKRLEITDLDSILDCYIDLVSNDGISCLGFGGVQNYFSGVDVFSENSLSKRLIPYWVFIRNAKYFVNWTNWYAEDDIATYTNNSLGMVSTIVPYILAETEPIGTGSMQDVYESNNSFIMAMSELRYFPNILLIYIRPKYSIPLFGVTRKNHNWYVKILSGRYKK